MASLSVAEVVRMQVSSPDFGYWCVSNVSNSDYDYLFSNASKRRAEYESALAAAAPSAGSAMAIAPVNGSTPTVVTVGLSKQPPSAGAFCRIPVPDEKTFNGPHQPYVLSGASKQCFEDLLMKLHAATPATLGPNSKSPEVIAAELIQFMNRRRTKTESMMHRMVAAMGGLSTAKRLQTFYVTSALLYEHHRTSDPDEYPPYLPVFEVYIPEALRLALYHCSPGDSDVAYLATNVDTWEASRALSRDALQQMRLMISLKSGNAARNI